MKKKFAWEKWYNLLDDEVESMKQEAREEPAVFNEEEMENGFHGLIVPQQPPPVGFVSAIIEQNQFINSFDFWVLHTNFDITEEIRNLIESISGVESITVLTRYRVKIGLTKSGLFNNSQVKQVIQNKILGMNKHKNSSIKEDRLSDMSFDTATQETIEQTKQDLGSSDHKFWSFYVFPNGELSVHEMDSKDELDEKIQIFQTLEYLIGGKVFYSTSE